MINVCFAGFSMITCGEVQPIKCKTDADCAKYKVPNFKCIWGYCVIRDPDTKHAESKTLQPGLRN